MKVLDGPLVGHDLDSDAPRVSVAVVPDVVALIWDEGSQEWRAPVAPISTYTYRSTGYGWVLE